MTKRDYARSVFALDVRSLAVMRIAVAVTVLVDLFTRLVHLTEHYSDDGVLPRETARSLTWLVDTSLISISGSPVWAGIVFAVGIALALAVLIGVRTRLSTLGLWLVVLAIQHRNPVLWDHRDALFSIALCYGLLLPWGEAFSLDARRAPPREHRYLGVPAAAYVLQIAFIYVFAALLKTGPEWRSDFTAVERAISLEYWARPIAQSLADHPSITSFLTIAVLGFEFAIAPLLLCPWRTGLARWLVVGGLCLLQLGFAVFLWLDTFPMIAAAMTLGLLPASSWSRKQPALRDESSRPATVLASLLLGYTLALNVLSLDSDTRSTPVHRPAQLLGIDQSWTMFAPSPARLDGWLVVEAKRADGQAIDLLTDRPVGWPRPDSFREGIRTTRELVYLRRLLAVDEVRESFAAAQCRREPRPVRITVTFVGIYDGVPQAPERLVAHECR